MHEISIAHDIILLEMLQYCDLSEMKRLYGRCEQTKTRWSRWKNDNQHMTAPAITCEDILHTLNTNCTFIMN